MISSSAPAAAIPPHDLEAEDSVLGAVLLDKTAISKVVDILTPEDFYRENNGQIYKAALNLNQRGEPIDHITLSAELEKRGILERVGGRAHLALLHEQTPTAANVEHYARIVKDLATKRRLIVAGQEIVRLGHDDQLESAEVIELSSRLQERASVGNIPSWEPPIPLDMLCQLPEFPAYVLPPWLVSFISALAESTQTPIDLAGMLALDVLSTAAGGRVQLRINSDWSEPLNLYTAVALSPGERKSSVFRAMTKPLLEFEKQMVVEKSYELSQARARRRVREKALEAAQNAAARAEGMEQEKLLERVDIAALELQDAIVPAEFRLIADDATPESLATLIADQRGKMAVLSPEGGIFGQMAGRYGNQPNLDVYLKGHAGDLLKVDRKGRPSEYIEEPALTVGLTVQPEVIRAMAVQPGFEGKGLPARFLYSMPVSRVGSRKIEVAPVPEQVAQEYASELKLLARNLEQLPQLYILTVSKRAQAMLDDFRRELEPKLGDDGELGHIRYWGCKLAG
ncbi:MAG: DUF3987 domain-containing protein, partial [Candidatus Dormibacteraceae bacterium]